MRFNRFLPALALLFPAMLLAQNYGVDTVETAEGVVVLEVNEFPNFTAVAGAAGALADHVLARAEAWEVMPVGVGPPPGTHRTALAV